MIIRDVRLKLGPFLVVADLAVKDIEVIKDGEPAADLPGPAESPHLQAFDDRWADSDTIVAEYLADR